MNRTIHRTNEGLVPTYATPQRHVVRSGSTEQLYAAQYAGQLAALKAAEAELPALKAAEAAARKASDQASAERARLSAAITRVDTDLEAAKRELGQQAADSILDGRKVKADPTERIVLEAALDELRERHGVTDPGATPRWHSAREALELCEGRILKLRAWLAARPRPESIDWSSGGFTADGVASTSVTRDGGTVTVDPAA